VNNSLLIALLISLGSSGILYSVLDMLNLQSAAVLTTLSRVVEKFLLSGHSRQFRRQMVAAGSRP
jgi:hypothetical protein